MTEYTCCGIGKGAVCGATATVKIPATKWNAEKQMIEEIYTHLCPRHADELNLTMTEKFKTGQVHAKDTRPAPADLSE
jgi:hypothetical protein